MDVKTNPQDIVAKLEMLNSPVAHEAAQEIMMLRQALRPFAAKLKVVQHQSQTKWAGIAVTVDDVIYAAEVYKRKDGG